VSSVATRRASGRRLSVPALPPPWGARLAALAALLTLLAAGYLVWFRDSSFVRIDEVTVTGLTSDDAGEIRAALDAAAGDMSTLHLRPEELERAVEGFPVVRALELSTDFPNGLRVHVLEHQPAALVVSGESKVPAAADGSVLRGVSVRGALPTIELDGALPAERIQAGRPLALLRVAGAAPRPLVARIEGLDLERERGVVVALEEGPELVFGEARRARDQWLAAARVLADPAAEGASYIDVRLPERPAAGGLSVDSYSQP
jgi:cell division protein FtsQ